ncbi:MAG: hypothetical protein ACQESC_03130 [Nanobdellota archaeon]
MSTTLLSTIIGLASALAPTDSYKLDDTNTINQDRQETGQETVQAPSLSQRVSSSPETFNLMHDSPRFRPSSSINIFSQGLDKTQYGLGTLVSLKQSNVYNGGEAFLKFELMRSFSPKIEGYFSSDETTSSTIGYTSSPLFKAGFMYATEDLDRKGDSQTHFLFGADVQFNSLEFSDLPDFVEDDITSSSSSYIVPYFGIGVTKKDWAGGLTIGVPMDSGFSDNYFSGHFDSPENSIFLGTYIGAYFSTDFSFGKNDFDQKPFFE